MRTTTDETIEEQDEERESVLSDIDYIRNKQITSEIQELEDSLEEGYQQF